MTDKKDLQEEELEKVNGGLTYKKIKYMSIEKSDNSICGNFISSFPDAPTQSCGECEYLFIDEKQNIYCTDYADDFHAIDPNADASPRPIGRGTIR